MHVASRGLRDSKRRLRVVPQPPASNDVWGALHHFICPFLATGRYQRWHPTINMKQQQFSSSVRLRAPPRRQYRAAAAGPHNATGADLPTSFAAIMATHFSFHSPLAKHLHKAAATPVDGVSQRLPGSERRAAPSSITSIDAALPRGGEPLGVSSPSSTGRPFRLGPGSPGASSALQSTADSAVRGQAGSDGDLPAAAQLGAARVTTRFTGAAEPVFAVDEGPAAALQEMAASKQRAAVAAAAAAMQSPAAAPRPGGRSGVPALTTPMGRFSASAASAAAAATAATPPQSGGSIGIQSQLRSSFKQQAQQLLLHRQGAAMPALGATPAGLAAAGNATQRHRPLLQRQQQQQAPPPPAASLEDALGQLQLGSSLAAAAATATPGLTLRSRGERQAAAACTVAGLLFSLVCTTAQQPWKACWVVCPDVRLVPQRCLAGLFSLPSTPLGTPRAAAAGGAAGPPAEGAAAQRMAAAATPAPRGEQQRLLESQPQQQQQQALWSPMLPPAAAPGAAQGAGLLRTVRRTPGGGRQEGRSRQPEAATPQAAPGAAAASTAAATPQPGAGPGAELAGRSR